ncbi:hypothetical protein [Streptomyces collinus]|uniref:hypothetical protein n=1 Tax=Streptomyces collinus TaxID=42684 RepID=UPI0037D7433D
MSTAEEDQAEGRALLPADLTDDFAACAGAADRCRENAACAEYLALERPVPAAGRPCAGSPSSSRPSTTRAGSHESRWNVTAECVLGLPKEVRR